MTLITIVKQIKSRPNITLQVQEAVIQGCSVEKVFLEISQNSQENTCARVSFLIKTLGGYFLSPKVPTKANHRYIIHKREHS